MTWFKVGDTFDDDPRMFDAPDCAVSLWTRAGVWCSRNLTDGRVPAGLPSRKCDDPDRAVAELVRRGIWEATDDGWVFLDWFPDQPSREQVLEKRRKETERKATMRAALAQKRRTGRSARPSGTRRGTPAGTPGGSPERSPALPDPGSPPSSGTHAAAEGPPAREPLRPVGGSPEAREIARRGMEGIRPLLAQIAEPSAPSARGRGRRRSDVARADQDRLAELDAVQADPEAPDGPSPPDSLPSGLPTDQQEQESA